MLSVAENHLTVDLIQVGSPCQQILRHIFRRKRCSKRLNSLLSVLAMVASQAMEASRKVY